MNLEQYLRAHLGDQILDHSIRAQKNSKGSIFLCIHPAHKDGITLDFVVEGNQLRPCDALGNAGTKVFPIDSAIQLKLDGDMWCCLYGTDPQQGDSVFAETRDAAVSKFRAEFPQYADMPIYPCQWETDGVLRIVE